MRHVRASIAAAGLVAASLVGHDAAAMVQSKCLVGKNKCISKKAEALLACWEKAQKPGKPADPNDGGCVDKAMRAFDGGARPEKGCFEKLEDKRQSDCVTLDDGGMAEAIVDACVERLVKTINPDGSQTKCAAGKVDCVTKKLKGLLSCYREAQTPAKPVDPVACIVKVKDRFDGGIATPEKGCFEKLEGKSKSDCKNPVDNTAELEDVVDDCVDALVVFLEGTDTVTTTTVPETTTTTTTTTSSTDPPTTTTTESGDTTTTVSDPEPTTTTLPDAG